MDYTSISYQLRHIGDVLDSILADMADLGADRSSASRRMFERLLQARDHVADARWDLPTAKLAQEAATLEENADERRACNRP